MQAHRPFNIRLLLACLAAAALWQVRASAAQTPSLDLPLHLSDFALVKSEFTDDVRFGKDPFFPTSRRRYGQQVTTPVQPDAPVTELLTLKGISGSRHQPLAIINNRTFAVGETADLRVNNQVLRVQCVEINDKVVKITINGVPQELSRAQR